jgi:hypothetical protein
VGRIVVVTLLALAGLLSAAGMGFAAYYVSRDSVAVPVTRLQPAPQKLTPRRVRTHSAPTVQHPATTTTRTVTPTTTVDDHGGGSGSGSGRGGGGHGSDD